MLLKASALHLFLLTSPALAVNYTLQATIPLSGTPDARFAVDETHGWLVAPNLNNALDVFSLQTFKPIKQVKLQGNAQALHFSPDGKLLYVFVDETSKHVPGLQVFQTGTWKQIKEFSSTPYPILESHITNNGLNIYAINKQNEVLRWNTQTGQMDHPWKDFFAGHLAVSQKGDSAAIFFGPELYFLSTSSGKVLSKEVLGDAFAYTALSFNLSGDVLATVIDSGVVMLWDPKTFKKTAEFKTSLTHATFLKFSSDGKKVLIGQDYVEKGQKGLFQVWNLADKKMLASFGNSKDSAKFGLFSKNSKYLFLKTGTNLELWK